MKVILCKTDGSVEDLQLKKEPTLEQMYRLIGCRLVEHLDLVQGVHLWVDEEGRLNEEAEVNPVATKYFLKAFPPERGYLFPGGVMDIVGNAIIIDKTKAGWL